MLNRLPEAVAFALDAHGGQERKDGSPYASHLLQVCGLVLEHGGSETVALAALLHDVIEDTGVEAEEIESRFGPEVAAIVTACTDSIEGEGRGRDTWERRKALYLEHLRTASSDAALVSACDKLHNLRAMAHGDVDDAAFNAPRERQRWFFESMVSILDDRGDVPSAVVEELRSLTDRAWR